MVFAAFTDRLRSAADLAAGTVRVLRDSGMLSPVRPDRLLRLPLQAVRYGPTPALAGAAGALRWPDRTAIIDERGSLTYAELEARSAAQATALRLEVGEGRKVGILCRNHRGFAEAALAASRLGRDVVFLNTDFSGPQLARVLAQEDVAVLVHDEEFTAVAEGFEGVRVIAWHDRPAELPTLDGLARTPAAPLVAERPSKIVILTSGTTGHPKGASHDFGPLAALSQGFGHLLRVPLRSGGPILVGPPLFHGLGLTYLMAGLGIGAPVVLMRRFDAATAAKLVEEHRAEVLVAVPVMLQRLLDEVRGGSLASLRVVLSGGAALHPHLACRFLDRFGDVLYNAYGASETGWATIATPADLREAPGTVGRPTLGTRARVLGDDGHELPAGEIGTLFLDAGLKFRGYTGGGTKEQIDGMTSTGDLGHLDAAGRVFIDGRSDDMIVSGGENVFPAEVEDVLDAHPEVAEAAVAGVEDERFGQRLAAWVVRVPGSSVSEAELQAHVKAELARYKVPREITFVPELPRTTTGKIRHKALQER
ncbi:AMP-binding protein [Actinocorallia longicatena]|uniref:Acyl-CoA ligase FadD12 n=1 Tax=Actinocorallia longicatena TaxID=111803 RepID=A0ABP6Q0Q1_9ACTN